MSRVPLRWRATLALLRRLPQGALSRMTGRLAELQLPRPVRGPLIRGFARMVGADLSEVAEPPESFASVSGFFTRRLAPGTRRWPEDPAMPASPVDAEVGAVGRIEEGRALQAKGYPYRIDELLGSPERAEAFREGRFVTLYLSPRHYHRIHTPVSGAVEWARAQPGGLLPVNDPAVRTIPDLFVRNERLVADIRCDPGSARVAGSRVAVVAVGAFNVGRISSAFDPDWNDPSTMGVTNRRGSRSPEARVYEPEVPMERGEELMAFHLGSTVVLLFAGGHGVLDPGLVPGAEIRLGQALFGG